MKTLMLATIAVVFAAAATLSPVAMAAQAVDNGPQNAATAHYEWQYHYVGHHPRYEGHWVLVR